MGKIVNNKIEKLNILNELRSSSMSLQELRFLSIYLSKINARDKQTREVLFPLDDFKKILDLGRLNIAQLDSATDSLLQKIVKIPYSNGGFDKFQLFSRCKLIKQSEEWFIEINAHDEALTLFFEFKEKYFTYELWNALRLKSTNQMRMYEILKQHEKQNTYTFELQELRELLGVEKTKYKRFGDFKIKVLEACKIALKENTDIKYEYKLVKKGAKVVSITFYISKNKDYKDPLHLDEFLDIDDIKTIEADFRELEAEEKPKFKNKKLEFLADSCNNEFTEDEMQILFNLISSLKTNTIENIDTVRYRYLKSKYDEMNSRKPNKSRLGYLKTLISADVEGGVLIG